VDTESLIRLLRDRRVDFVIIGATAFPVHGYARATLDIDLFFRPERANAERLLDALKDFGYDVTDVNVDDILNKKILIRQYAVEADFHPFVKGVTFDEVWERKVEERIGETRAFFASLDDLISMKRSAGRVKDLEDLKFLVKLKEGKK